MKVTKMHGIGNDYLYFHEEVPDNVSQLARVLSDRHTGIGSDGLIYITHSDTADFGMRIFNADGSEAKMCGNGIRCVGRYVFEKGLSDHTELKIETASGIRELILHVKDGRAMSVSVNMGPAEVGQPVSLSINEKELILHPVSTGNPHAVIFTDEAGLSLTETIGPLIEHHELFPEGVNAEFVFVKDETHLRMRVWERGSGVTMACGTGATASAAAALALGVCSRKMPVSVQLDGGVLEISCDESGMMWMKGPAEFVFEAEIEMKGDDLSCLHSI